MKNFILCFALLFVSLSCSSDLDPDKNVGAVSGPDSIKNVSANFSNPINSIGKKYYDHLQLYLRDNGSPNSVKEIADQIRFMASIISDSDLQGEENVPLTDEMVETLLADPKNSLIELVKESSLSNRAKDQLVVFLQSLLDKREQEFEELNKFIISFERVIYNDPSLNLDEKETILSVTTISTYSLDSEEEHRDRDWETNMGSKMDKPYFKTNIVPIISTIAMLKNVVR